MQIEEPIVGRCGIYFEIAGVDENPNRRVDGEGDAIHQAVGDLDGMNGEWAHAEALAAHDGVQLRFFQQPVLFQASQNRAPELWWLVEDVEAAYRGMSASAELSTPLRQMPFGTCFGIADPSGHVHYVLEFAQQRPSQDVS